MNRKIFIIMMVALLLILSACTTNKENVEGKDLGDVVAIVNNREITRADFEEMLETVKSSYMQNGIDIEGEGMLGLIEEEALNNLIQYHLLLQGAKDNNHQITAEELENEILLIKAQFDSEEEFLNILEENNLTLAQLEERIANEMMLNRFIADMIGEPEVSEEEIKALYEEYRLVIENIPPYEEVISFLEEELKYQKFQESLEELIENLRSSSTIEIFI